MTYHINITQHNIEACISHHHYHVSQTPLPMAASHRGLSLPVFTFHSLPLARILGSSIDWVHSRHHIFFWCAAPWGKACVATNPHFFSQMSFHQRNMVMVLRYPPPPPHIAIHSGVMPPPLPPGIGGWVTVELVWSLPNKPSNIQIRSIFSVLKMLLVNEFYFETKATVL